MKHAITGIVLMSAMFSGALSAQTLTSRGCGIGGVTVGGDESLSTISSTGSADLPCLVEFRPLMESNGRGRINYVSVNSSPPAPPVAERASGQDPLRGRQTLSLSGFLSAASDLTGAHKASIFGIALDSDQLDRELRVSLLVRNNEYRMQVSYVDSYGAQSTPLGEIIIDKSAAFGIALSESARKGFLDLRLSNGSSKVSFRVAGTLLHRDMSGWSYGLLLDDSADNQVPYSLLLTHGPRPQITKR